MARFIQTSGHPSDATCYAEAAYFDGFAFAHIAAREEWARAETRTRRDRRQWDRRTGARAGLTGRRYGDKV